MRTSLRVVLSLAGWLLVVLCLTGCQRSQEPTDPTPPFTKVDDIVSMSSLWGAYETKPVKEADKEYKGKILQVLDVGDLPWSKTVLQDGKGRKYFSIVRRPGKPNEERELVRCYLYRPENPIVEEQDERPDSFGVKGVCKGICDGVIILENCTIFTHFSLAGW
jgi:hypothetical protein